MATLRRTSAALLFLFIAFSSSSASGDRLRCNSLRQDGRSLRTTLTVRMFQCTAPLFEAFARGNTTRDFRSAVDDFCNDFEQRVCVADVARIAKHCLKATDLLEFRVNQDNLRMVLGEVCLRRGVRAATLFGGEVRHADTGERYPLWQACYLNLEHIMNRKDPFGDSIAKYRFLRHFRACVATLGEGQTYVVNASVDLFNRIIEKFKCVHPVYKKKEVYCYVLGDHHLTEWVVY